MMERKAVTTRPAGTTEQQKPAKPKPDNDKAKERSSDA